MKKQTNLKIKEVFKNENKRKQEKIVQTILNKLIRNFIEHEHMLFVLI